MEGAILITYYTLNFIIRCTLSKSWNMSCHIHTSLWRESRMPHIRYLILEAKHHFNPSSNFLQCWPNLMSVRGITFHFQGEISRGSENFCKHSGEATSLLFAMTSIDHSGMNRIGIPSYWSKASLNASLTMPPENQWFGV